MSPLVVNIQSVRNLHYLWRTIKIRDTLPRKKIYEYTNQRQRGRVFSCIALFAVFLSLVEKMAKMPSGITIYSASGPLRGLCAGRTERQPDNRSKPTRFFSERP
jgi:hypothetical protein